jgi:hypothetical protein
MLLYSAGTLSQHAQFDVSIPDFDPDHPRRFVMFLRPY